MGVGYVKDELPQVWPRAALWSTGGMSSVELMAAWASWQSWSESWQGLWLVSPEQEAIPLTKPRCRAGAFYREMGAAQYGSIQDSEKARAQVLWALPSRSLGKGVPLANRPLTMRRAAPAGIRTVATPWGRPGLPPGSR